jgi:16S rRNA (guanine966-N2)-methyltransferase
MSIRITGGSERGRRLRATVGAGLRPTSDRIRAALFSMIGGGAVDGARVLDVYAGTGALGIEALSRGASWADFVEVHPRRCQDIRRSLHDMGMADRAHVIRARVEKALRQLAGEYDLILADPPYDADPWDTVMDRLSTRELLADGALVVVEHRHSRRLDERYGRLVRDRTRRHGDSSISIYLARASVG